jgi:glycerol-3-phosphate dehydrogenase
VLFCALSLLCAVPHYAGAWACAAAKIVARNCGEDDPADLFCDDVKMWVFEEEVDGQKLTDIINTQHENVKYLPGISLGSNVVAVPDLEVRGDRQPGCAWSIVVMPSCDTTRHCAAARECHRSAFMQCSSMVLSAQGLYLNAEHHKCNQ